MNTVDVLDSTMAYRSTGTGPTTVVFLHGNPTSSHFWRNVLPHVADHARCLAPDLIGMGESGKPDIGYRFADHARYLDAWFAALDLHDVVLVGHDWGGALALDRAARHPRDLRGIALTETFVRPLTWAEYPPGAVALFKALRTEGPGEQMALDDNWFIETALRATNPTINDTDLAVYREPYPDRASRRPLLQWPREIPLDGEPADVGDRFVAFDRWLADSAEVPKLLLTTEPGGIVSADIVRWCRDHVTGLEVESIGAAGHHVAEDQPDAIAKSLVSWLDRHRLT